jgi:hypothetical protein
MKEMKMFRGNIKTITTPIYMAGLINYIELEASVRLTTDTIVEIFEELTTTVEGLLKYSFISEDVVLNTAIMLANGVGLPATPELIERVDGAIRDITLVLLNISTEMGYLPIVKIGMITNNITTLEITTKG